MEIINYIPEKDGFNFSKFIRRMIIAALILIVFVILMAAGQIVFLLQALSWLENMVRSVTGLDAMLSKGIASILLAIILILPIGGLIWSFLPFPQKNKKLKRALVFAVFGILCITSYFSSQNVYFDYETGKPLKYYSISVSGEYKFYTSGGYDTQTGAKLMPVNKEVVTKYLNHKKNTSDEETTIEVVFGMIGVLLIACTMASPFFILAWVLGGLQKSLRKK